MSRISVVVSDVTPADRFSATAKTTTATGLPRRSGAFSARPSDIATSSVAALGSDRPVSASSRVPARLPVAATSMPARVQSATYAVRISLTTGSTAVEPTTVRWPATQSSGGLVTSTSTNATSAPTNSSDSAPNTIDCRLGPRGRGSWDTRPPRRVRRVPDAAALAAEHQQELEAVAVVDREPRHEQLVVLDHRPQLLGLGQPLLDRGHDVVGVGPRHLQTGDLAIGELEGQRGLEVLGLDVDARIVDPDQHDAGVRDLLLLVADRDVDLVLVRLRVNADRCVHLHAVDQPPAAQQEPVEQPG